MILIKHTRQKIVHNINQRIVLLVLLLMVITPVHVVTARAPDRMVKILSGEFLMGPDPVDEDISPAHTVYLNAFYIDKYEVTVKEYARFLNESGGDSHFHEYMARSSDCGIVRTGENRYIVSPGREKFPIIYVKWDDAAAYAAWAGKRLPTEAEWERTARGTEGRTYPWGNEEPDSTRANYYFMNGGTVQVGSFPKGRTPEKVYDMAGNVWEFCADEPAPYPEERVENPLKPAAGRGVMRGGCWATPAVNLKSTLRETEYKVRRNAFTGFRCAKDVE